MPSRRLYYDDSYTTRFTARVSAALEREGGAAIELEATYFYPESGGQEADRGRLGAAAVVDVQSDEADRVWHRIEGASPAPGAELEAELDWERRFDHMQQHTGQHILSAAFERELEGPTLSSHLGPERSGIEVGLGEVDWRTVERLERSANRIVWEDRPIERHWVDDEGVRRFALRKPPKFTGRIRIVEIPDWDVSACGGTHTRRTGEVGVIKIVRWEKVRGNLRFEFLCGGRALSDYGWRTEALLEGARRRTLKDRELIAHLERAAEERDQLRKRVQEMSERLILAEARERVGPEGAPLTGFEAERDRADVRLLAIKGLEAGAPWVALGAGGPTPVLVVGRAKGGTLDLRTLVPELIVRGGGKGGGAPDLLQLAPADRAGAERAWRWAVETLQGGAAR